MNLLTIWMLMWEMWVAAPSCAGSCKQGRGQCNCKKEKASD